MQDVYIAVHEGGFSDLLGNIVIQWQLGNGEYTAVVHDGCTQEALGYIEFQIGSPKDKGKPPTSKRK
jgi:hypothetical protein